MQKKYFVERVKKALRDQSAHQLIDFYDDPPGRGPSKKTRRLSNWYHALSEEQKKGFKEIVEDVLDTAIFEFLCTLDGDGFIETDENPWGYELYAVKDQQKILLNDPDADEEMLHDLYQHLTYESD
jgi:hypothetical protein